MPTDDAVNSVRFRGDLEKQGRFSTWSWKCYWFMLDDDQLCYFHQEKQQTRAQGLIDLSQAKKVCICPLVNHGFAFEIVSANRRHVLSASTPELREKWMKNLHVAMCLRRRRSSVMFTASCNTISDAGSSDDEEETEKTLPKKGSRLVNIFSKKPSSDKRATMGGIIEVPMLDEPPPPASKVVMRKKNLSESDIPQPMYTSGQLHSKSIPNIGSSGATEWPLRKKRTDSMNNYLDVSDYKDRNLKTPSNPAPPVVTGNGVTDKEDMEESEFLKMVKAANPVDVRSSRLEDDEAVPSLMVRSFSKQYSHVQRHTMPNNQGSASTPMVRSVSRQAASCGYKSSELKRCGSDSSLNNFFFDDDDDDDMLEEEEETEDDVFKSDPPVEMRPKNGDEAKDEYFRNSLPPMTELKGLDLTNHTRYSLMPLMEMSESVSSESQEESSRQSSQCGSINVPSRQGSQGSVVSANGAATPVAGTMTAGEDSTDGILVEFPPIPELPNPRQELTWGSSGDQIREFIAKNRGPRELYLPPKSTELSGKAMENLKGFLKVLESDA